MFTHHFVSLSNLEGERRTISPCHSRLAAEAVSKSQQRKEGDLVPCFQHITITFAHVCKTFASMQGQFAARP